MSYEKFIKGIYRQKSKNLEKLGIDWNSDPKEEYLKIQSLLYTEYHILGGSQLTIQKKYLIPSTRTIDILFRTFEIESRDFSDAKMNSVKKGRQELMGCKPFGPYKSGWHKTWEGKNVFLRSSLEFNYALQLDNARISYDCESLRIKYFDKASERYRIAIPDFFLKETNTIVEIKSKYWLDLENMLSKQKAYKESGFNFKLIVEGVEVDIGDHSRI